MNKNAKPGKKKIKELLKRREAFSLLLILAFMALALASIFINPRLYLRSMHEGDIALKDVYAPYNFAYIWGTDEEKTQRAREDASRAVPYYIDRDAVVDENIRTNLENFFIIVSNEAAEKISLSEKVNNLREKTGVDLLDKDYKTFLGYSEGEALKKEILRIAKNVLHAGFISEKDLDVLERERTEKVEVYDNESGLKIERAPRDLLNKGNVRSAIDGYVQEYFGEKRRIKGAVAALVAAYLEPNLRIDEKKTGSEKEIAAEKVQPVPSTWKVRKNEIIIEKGKRVNARHIVQLSQLRSFLREGKPQVFFMGTVLLFLLLGIIGSVYMAFVQQVNFLKNTRGITIVLLNMFFMVIVTDFVIRLPQPSYFIPMAGMGMMLILLVGFSAAFLSVVLMSILVAVLTGGGIEVALVLIAGSIMGMYAVRGARRRASILWAGALAGAAKFLAIICVGLINGIGMSVYLKDGIWGISSGLLSGVIVMGFLPVFEYLFKVSTNISLLEMSDLNLPLLKKLSVEAPGTHHHSIMVGNLAEAACDSINANSLLARVGAYYHDIGKIPKPQYFSENEMGEGSRHQGLTTSMSALIIVKHVKEGMEIAKKYKLNDTIIDFIQQHHGDSLITYFYQKAREEAKDGAVLEEENFRYPGPKPQTRETAIVLLADAVEASSRVLDEPTPSSIRNLVKKVMNNKFIDGQLDGCDLTLKDMRKIADAFVRVLMASFHTRANYPEEEKEAKPGEAKPNGKNKLRKQKF